MIQGLVPMAFSFGRGGGGGRWDNICRGLRGRGKESFCRPLSRDTAFLGGEGVMGYDWGRVEWSWD